MSDMNITPEQIQAAMEAMGGGEQSAPRENPVMDIIKDVTKDGKVKNVIKVQGGELRCIVSNNGEIKDTTIIDGATVQDFNPEEDVIAWCAIVDGTRHMLKQNDTGIHNTGIDSFGAMFGSKTGYALSYLSSFNGNNNILLDDAKVAKFEDAAAYAESLMGESDNGLKTLITSMCTNTDDYRDICQTWDKAEIFDNTTDDHVITWGCVVETEKEYVKFETSYTIIWARPFVMNADGNEVPDELIQVVTRQVNPDKVPQLGWNSKANFTVDETINDQVIAYAMVTEDTINSKLTGIKLFKTESFDVNKTSF